MVLWRISRHHDLSGMGGDSWRSLYASRLDIATGQAFLADSTASTTSISNNLTKS